ncbi:class I SAM-dependent methyltransferase [Leptospira santarosai]|uniref:class I SAM-dependent methyltransferase n=1 Tax=Leptospira santarosai TaxID=28183 RepID=UPI000774E1E5|nr:class I SAM-dependent methyltransferase [Leptospira santarosai]
MNSQKKVFLSGEGDQWFIRNKNILDEQTDILIQTFLSIQLKPKKVLEIGCSNGRRLSLIQSVFASECYGIDPSKQGIEEGKRIYQNLSLQVATADNLPFEDNTFDTIIFGFCLYLCDRKDLFKIAYEADRCLSENGHIVIKDFYPPFPYRNNYSHYSGLFSYKMNYEKMFEWNPIYKKIFCNVFSHDGFLSNIPPDERIGIIILNKNEQQAYPLEPFCKEKL